MKPFSRSFSRFSLKPNSILLTKSCFCRPRPCWFRLPCVTLPECEAETNRRPQVPGVRGRGEATEKNQAKQLSLSLSLSLSLLALYLTPERPAMAAAIAAAAACLITAHATGQSRGVAQAFLGPLFQVRRRDAVAAAENDSPKSFKSEISLPRSPTLKKSRSQAFPTISSICAGLCVSSSPARSCVLLLNERSTSCRPKPSSPPLKA